VQLAGRIGVEPVGLARLEDERARAAVVARDRERAARRPIYEAEDVASGLDELPEGLLAAPQRLAALPFAPARSGRVYRTLLIEAPIFLATLVEEVRRAGGAFETRSFSRPDELAALPEPALVNFLGVGAGAVARRRACVVAGTTTGGAPPP